ncbi:unnamed protein product, partial [Didymodactylos carnosus]
MGKYHKMMNIRLFFVLFILHLQSSKTQDVFADVPSNSSSTRPSVLNTTALPAPTDVSLNISWTYAVGTTRIKMMINNLKAQQWIAMGLSLDGKMGETHVFLFQHFQNNTLDLIRLINPSDHDDPVAAPPHSGGSFSIVRTQLINNVILCEFTLSNFTATDIQQLQNIPPLTQTTSYHPIIALGRLVGQ